MISNGARQNTPDPGKLGSGAFTNEEVLNFLIQHGQINLDKIKQKMLATAPISQKPQANGTKSFKGNTTAPKRTLDQTSPTQPETKQAKIPKNAEAPKAKTKENSQNKKQIENNKKSNVNQISNLK